MKKFLKSITSLLLIIGVTTCFVGCGKDSPSEVVKKQFSKIKDGSYEKEAEIINSTSGELDPDIEKAMNYKIIEVIKDVDAKIINETIEDDVAIVEVEISGKNIAKSLQSCYPYMLSLFYNGLEEKEVAAKTVNYFIEDLNNQEKEIRRGKIELVKNTDGDWIVNDDSELQYLVMGGNIEN